MSRGGHGWDGPTTPLRASIILYRRSSTFRSVGAFSTCPLVGGDRTSVGSSERHKSVMIQRPNKEDRKSFGNV